MQFGDLLGCHGRSEVGELFLKYLSKVSDASMAWFLMVYDPIQKNHITCCQVGCAAVSLGMQCLFYPSTSQVSGFFHAACSKGCGKTHLMLETQAHGSDLPVVSLS